MVNNLIVLTGATAVGKTDLSIKLALHFGAEIISADSRQFFKELKIGTAPPEAHHLEAVKHHFIGHLSVNDHYDVVDYERDAIGVITELHQSKKANAMIVGGSGLYVDAVTKGFDDMPNVDEKIRKDLWDAYESKGLEPLQVQLQLLDPVHYSNVDLANPKRVIRALEVCLATGKPYSSLLNTSRPTRDFNSIKICLNRDRAELYNRINMRVDLMVEAGLVEEAREFYPLRHLNALNTVGYKELFAHFDGTCSLEEAVTQIKTDTRHFAKRQVTWFKRDPDYAWFSPDDESSIISYIESRLVQ